MKQVSLRPRDGRIAVVDVPLPTVRPGWVLVANYYSVISAGTERGKVALGQKSVLAKARARPDLVRKVVERARTEGVGTALAVARDRLDALAPLGYASAGVVLRIGEGVEGLATGDRVACAGSGFASHSEVVAIPKNLVARVPSNVDLADAAYATLGAIALHAVRLSGATVGERVGVIGLGLVGQLAIRILKAAGCLPIGVDLDKAALDLARNAGVASFDRGDPALEAAVENASSGLGLDAVLVCAASSSADPVELAAHLSRDRGRVVIVGDVPVAADRSLLYEKELELRVSRSYGPGRYDRDYEEHGRDLPAGYVRWTEQRNLQAFVDLVAAGRIDPSTLTTHRFPVDRAAEAYAVLSAENGDRRPFGVLLEYGEHSLEEAVPRPRVTRAQGLRVAVIGAGAFARSTLLPLLTKEGAVLTAVSTASGLSAADVALRFGFERTAASGDEILAADDVQAVVIATRHGSHAALAARALGAGKAVFVEKPLALSADELAEVEGALTDDSVLVVGFNRRFAPLTESLRAAVEGVPECALLARVNAGLLPPDHWLHDAVEGGGRLLGEGCHFVDLLCHVAGSAPLVVQAMAVPQPERPLECSDCLVATLRFPGVVGTFLYSGGGDPRLPKERLEAFGGGMSAVLDDFRRLELYRHGKRTVLKRPQDKGHRAQLACFIDAAAGRIEPPSAASYLTSTRATLALAESLRTGAPVELA